MRISIFLLLVSSLEASDWETETERAREFTALNKKLTDAYEREDVATLRQLLADDHVHNNVFGMAMTKEEFLNDIESGELVFESYETPEIRWKIKGDTAIATGIIEAKAVRGGKPVPANRFLFTRIWVREKVAADWKVLLFHNTMEGRPPKPDGANLITTTEALVAAVRDGAEGSTIEIGAGIFELSAPLEPKPGMTIKGAGMDETIITHVKGWKPSTEALPDPEMRTNGLDSRAYLVRIQDKAAGVTISNLTLRGPQLHGAIFGVGNENLHLHHLRIDDVLWSGVRTFSMQGAKIHDCEFINAGGRWKRGGLPGVDGGITGGGIFAIWMKDSEISHNRFIRTQMEKQDEFYGIKVRQAKRCRVHHNTIDTGSFSMEFPFENDEDNEIDHNICHGPISLPKHAGGPVPESGRTFRIHHNYSTSGYAIEFVRNGIEIDHNLFDFEVEKDGGNLISGFGKAAAAGPAEFHNNLVNNPGRGVIWINEPYSNLVVRNNHIVARTTVTPRKEGLFGFNRNCDFSTFEFVDNIIEIEGLARPLMRNDESYGARIRNNQLTNVSDTDRYDNPQTDAKAGLEAPLKFECGVHGELTVDGWETRPTEK